MATNNEEFPEPEEEEISGIPEYNSLVTEVAERDVDSVDFSNYKTVTEAEEETVHKTDIQAILKALIPRMPNKRMDDLLQPALVSRIFPDNYTDKHFLLSAALIEESDPEADVDVISIISIVQDVLSKAYEGRHIVDLLELAGVAHEEEMEKLTKELGL